MMYPQLHQAIKSINSQTLTCTIQVPKFINSRLQLEQYLKRVNSFNEKKCLGSLRAEQRHWEPECQQPCSAMRSLAALQSWSRSSLIWFQKPRSLTSFAMVKREQIPIMRKCCLLPLPLPTNTLPDLSYQPLNSLAVLIAQGHRTAQAEGTSAELSWEKEPP